MPNIQAPILPSDMVQSRKDCTAHLLHVLSSALSLLSVTSVSKFGGGASAQSFLLCVYVCLFVFYSAAPILEEVERTWIMRRRLTQWYRYRGKGRAGKMDLNMVKFIS